MKLSEQDKMQLTTACTESIRVLQALLEASDETVEDKESYDLLIEDFKDLRERLQEEPLPVIANTTPDCED